ncbi:BnaC03g63340D [Brassica napus]|uniref:BnaC03g63340D protein n=1 Tax=Brassica napus TaxID=3708 RepID=A0A078F8E0_BRANA|nr:BnaC03g63340D [Brassica napus]
MSFEKKSPFLLECLNEQLTKDLKHQIFHTLSSVCLQKGLEPSLPNKAFHPHQKVIAPMNLQIEPPEKKKKNRTSPPPAPPSCPSFSLFPDEIFVNCLARISRMYYPTLSIISKSFRSLLSSTELYTARSHIGTTEQCLYVCLSDESYQSPQWFTLCINPNRTLTVSTIKKKKTVGKSLAPIPSSSDFPSTELSMPKCTRPSSAVRILDCRTHTWRDAPSMIVPRNHALTCFYDGKIYVMGGCGELEEPWAEVFETNTQTWKPLSDPGTEIRNIGSCTFYTIKEIKGKIFFWNPNRAYAYDTSQDNWESYAELWESTTCLIDGGVHYAFYHFRWTKDGGDWEVMKGVSSCIVSLLPFDGLVSELEKREEEEANGEQQELRRRIRG